MEKKLIYFFIAIAIVFFGHQYFSRPIKGEADNVRPYLEKCLDLIISKNYIEIYEQYFNKRKISIKEFNNRMKYLSKIFGGEPISYEYDRSYIGGIGYFIEYNIQFSNNKSYSGTFEFSIKESKKTIEKQELQALSISGDFGERNFYFFFNNGRVMGHKTPNISFGYDEKYIKGS